MTLREEQKRENDLLEASFRSMAEAVTGNATTIESPFPPPRKLLEEIRAAQVEADCLHHEHCRKQAMILLKAGIHLIPLDALADNEIAVSRAIYEAAREVCKEIEAAKSLG